MNTSESNKPLPIVEFRPTSNGSIDAYAILDHVPGGVRLRVHEELGKDEHWVTVERTGLQVKFCMSLFHLDCLIQSLAEFAEQLRKERGYRGAEPFKRMVPPIARMEEPR